MNEALAFKKLVRCSNYRFEAIRRDVSENTTQKNQEEKRGIATVLVFLLSMAPQLLVGQGLLFVEVLTLNSLTLARTHIHSLTHNAHSHTHTLTPLHTHSHSPHTHTHKHTHSLTNTHTHSRTLSLTHTHT